MKNKDAKWSIERRHTLTGAVFYLSPGEVNWVSVRDHEKYGTRYGRWTVEEAITIKEWAYKHAPVDFTYCLRRFEHIMGIQPG